MHTIFANGAMGSADCKHNALIFGHNVIMSITDRNINVNTNTHFGGNVGYANELK